MSVSVTELQSLRDAIVRAIANPTLRARSADGKEVQFRSVDEGKAALGLLDDEISKASSSAQSRVRLAQHKRGDGPTGPSPFYWENW